jgi:transglycosylase-like protein
VWKWWAEVHHSGSTVEIASSGEWAIPAPIVECESGFTNETPNSAGAAGYYQITEWNAKGGSGAPYANEHSKAEQSWMAHKLEESEGYQPWVSSEGCWGGRV